MDKVVYYYGKPIENLTREELIECINYLAGEVKELYAKNKRDKDFWFDMIQIKDNQVTKFNNNFWKKLENLDKGVTFLRSEFGKYVNRLLET